MERFNDERLDRLVDKRPIFPKKAVVTAGMPYGNKPLHCGHISTMIHSDMYARFLRDRIGKDNVVYVSGIDCYGSPILEGYRKAVEKGTFSGTIEDYVMSNYDKQYKAIKDYDISFNFYGASAFGEAKETHKKLSAEIFNTLMDNNALSNMSTLQFFDEEKQTFLNGRQVVGKCPFENCQSERAYADECDFGHQYMPQELIDPISSLSGKKPILKSIGNWYFNLQDYVELLTEWIDYLEKETPTRSYITKEIREFLKKPEIYIKRDQMEAFDTVKNSLPKYIEKETNNKSSMTIVFEKLTDREKACELLSNGGVRYRTGKTLVPFRLTGNIEWGVPAPDAGGLKGLTFWVWPESLWAPISFTKTYLAKIGKDANEWRKYWCSQDAKVYQFIGEDNIYFYGPAQTAIWFALQGKHPQLPYKDGDLSIPQMIANKHTLFYGRKASSSSDIKPPLAHELLNFYTYEQLRCHMLSLNVGNNNASFMPKAFCPDSIECNDDADIVLKEGNLLTNVYNKIIRTILYTIQRDCDGVVPYGTVSEQVRKDCVETIVKYERFVYDEKLHVVMSTLDSFIRNINKYWVRNSENTTAGSAKQRQYIIDTMHMIKVAMVLLHPIAPTGVENLAKFLKVDDKVFCWDNIDSPIYDFVKDKENYKPTFLEPRVDFFKKHPSQLVE